MEKRILEFTANEQILIKTSGIAHYASDVVSYVEAHFALGDNWSGFDSVRAVWFTDFKSIATVLDSEGACLVPFEVLNRKGIVRVNLVGSISEGDVLTDRLTTYPICALEVDKKAKVNGENTAPITPSQFEQFASAVRQDADRAEQGATASAASASASAQSASESASSATASEQSASQASGYAQNASESAVSAENAKDDAEDARDEIRAMRAEAVTLPAGSEATASYADGLLSLGIPRGNKGDTGDRGDTGATPNLTIGTVETLEPTEDATATITGTAENPVLNLGIPQGEQGDVSMAQLYSILPTDEASGSIASFSDGADSVPMPSLKVTLEPIQSGTGTPSPDNIRPISGRTEVVTQRTGKNLLDISIVKAGNSYYINGSDFPLKLKAGTYTFSNSGINAYAYWRLKGTSLNNVIHRGDTNQGTFTLTEDGEYSIWFYQVNVTAEDFGLIQLELGSTATDYEPYESDTYTTDLGRTVYGGTLDVVTGELVVDRAMVDLGSLNWALHAQGFMWSSGIRAEIKAPPTSSGLANIVCSSLESVTALSIYNGGNGIGIHSNGDARVRYDNMPTDPTAFKTAMSGVQLVYELSQAQTIQLSPTEVRTLLGHNNVWSDGDVSVKYKADVGLYIDKKLNGNITTANRTSLNMTKLGDSDITDSEPVELSLE